MKKTFSVNLGNRVFNIDEDAYFRLKAYLDTIERYFSDEKERIDIINDIEMRLSEIFLDRLSGSRVVITLQDVQEGIKTMGNPHEIGGEGKSIPEEEPVYDAYRNSSHRRRLYRDDDNRVIGGVCSGLGAYLDIDPVIIRIVLLVLFFLFGFGLLLYLILWIVVPKAVTTAQKLEMRGEPVNASNIGNFVREEFDSVKKSFQKRNK
jgi:phage shock protein PspC (stress-responsive transcriptional regulator)